MKVVGIRQLKARLSEYLRMVKGGATFLVTERDEVVAELGPCRRQRRSDGSVEEVLEALAERRTITRASAPKGDWKWKPRGLGLSKATVDSLLDDLRSERV